MAKFVITKEVPSPLREGEFVIDMPDFVPEIRSARAKPNTAKDITRASHLRSIAQMVAIKYDNTFDVLSKMGVHDFEGRQFGSDQDLSAIVLEMFNKFHPQIFSKYIDVQLKNRPRDTKIVYFTGPVDFIQTFFDNGLDRLEPKNVEVELGLKNKKVVGKPAVTNAEIKNDQ